nr:MAG TPA: hypothetical protein [Microviridae sp.]
MIQCCLVLSSQFTYLCDFVRLKSKSILYLRGAQIISNSVACVRDSRRVSERSGDLFEP